MFLKYLRFWMRSKNQHGVHSPFVYDFVTRCLYRPNLKIKKNNTNHHSKQLRLLLKIVDYFDVKCIASDVSQLADVLQTHGFTLHVTHFPPTAETEKFDLVLLHQATEKISVKGLLRLLKNDSILIINNIHSHKNKALWNELVNHPLVSVSIDVFRQGYIFIRKEQRKEHFTLRMPLTFIF
ncbi:hypothetical protein [Capnocytophaga canimorsus]|uniref:hypothetical protein n=1 Tax=Capnocytophaga canimorsus TaxID=28188 RepID=UPI0037D241F8